MSQPQPNVSKKAVRKGKKAVEKKFSTLKTLVVEYVSVDAISPNTWNPNRQSEHDFELLCSSMREDGFTQPIIVQRDSKQIVDGEHRWRAANALGYTEIPVVFTDMTPEQARISTLRHNRARGSEDIELAAQVLRDLQALGAIEHAQDSLGLDDEELNRLLEDVDISEALAAEEFSPAWVPDTIDQVHRGTEGHDGASVEQTETVTHGQQTSVAATTAAVEAMRARELKIAAAKTEEERVLAAKDRMGIYRLALVFAGDEADAVRSVLGRRPAVALVELCQAELERQKS